MSNGYRLNELTLYLRAPAAQPPYQEHNCARWLVRKYGFKSFREALAWLGWIYSHDTPRYNSVMAGYYAATDYRPMTFEFAPVNDYRSSATNYYGEDEQFWYHKRHITPKAYFSY